MEPNADPDSETRKSKTTGKTARKVAWIAGSVAVAVPVVVFVVVPVVIGLALLLAFAVASGVSKLDRPNLDPAKIAASQEAINDAFVEGDVFADPTTRLTFSESSYYSASKGAEKWVLTASSGDVSLTTFNLPDDFYEDLAVRDQKLVQHAERNLTNSEERFALLTRLNEDYGDVPEEQLPEYVSSYGPHYVVRNGEWVEFDLGVACGFLNDDTPDYIRNGCGKDDAYSYDEFLEYESAPYYAVEEFFASYLPENCRVSSEFSDIEPDFEQSVEFIEPKVSFGCVYEAEPEE